LSWHDISTISISKLYCTGSGRGIADFEMLFTGCHRRRRHRLWKNRNPSGAVADPLQRRRDGPWDRTMLAMAVFCQRA
jgi:hypothetical protein